MEPLKNKKKADQVLKNSALEHDNNDDNEFATTGLKANFSVETRQNDRDAKEASKSEAASEIPAGGSADKVDTASLASASSLEQKLNTRLDELVSLVEKAGEKIQRLGEAICRIGDQVEHLPERRFGVKRDKATSHNETSSSATPLN